MKSIFIKIFSLSILVLSFNNGCHNPVEPKLQVQSNIPQWGMFMHDARHTGNVNTPVEGITGPSGDSVTAKWRIPIDGGLIGSPAIGSDGTIYIGTDNQNRSDSCSVYAINPDGTIKWRYTPIPSIWSSPAIGNDGSIYVGTLLDVDGGGGLYALSSNGMLKWIHNPGENIISSPAIGKDGTVYYTNKDYLVALNSADGSAKWQLQDGDYYCSPAISSDGTIYYSSYGTITAVNPNGNIKWTYDDSSYAKQHVFGIEIGNDGSIYFVSSDSPFLYALDSKGKLKWKYSIGNFGVDPCLDTKGDIYAVTTSYMLLSINSTGNLEWESSLPITTGNLNSPLVIDNNGVEYIGVSGLIIKEPALLAYNQKDLIWSFGAGYPYNDGSITAAPTLYNGSLYFAWDSGEYYYFYCLQ